VKIPNVAQAIEIAKLARDEIQWVQAALKKGEYYAGVVDGIVGQKTEKAIAEFKEDQYLQFPTLIGQSTVMALKELVEPDPVSEQVLRLSQKPLIGAGTKTGTQASIPVAGLIHANQWIDNEAPGVTWGEFTKGLQRLPKTPDLVRNAIRFARVFSLVRSKFGSPLAITSGYRPPDVNRAIGGAKLSQHLNGWAADIYPLNGDFAKLLEILKATHQVGGIGLGQAKGFLHMDLRPTRVIWKYFK
jgi:Peptidase M15/Putative peptidoglycan binding domain